jgi:hypothetical protein
MNKTPEMIRQEMEETKSRLSDKLESLEHQVSETVQSTGSAVNATVGAVQGVVQSLSHVFDVRRHIDKHPWLALGGSALLGYLAAEYLAESAKNGAHPPKTIPSAPPSAEITAQEHAEPVVESAATTAALAAAYESGRKNSSWQQLRGMAIGACIGIVQDLATRAVPKVIDYFAGHAAGAPPSRTDRAEEPNGFPRPPETSEATRPRFNASSGNVRSGSSC